jgi:ABC-type multidrug transport system fused ATPase/permease subunit
MIITPSFIFPGIFITVLGAWLGHIYIRAQLSVKREQANAKSPVLAHFSAAISGLTSIRAYGAQAWYTAEMLKRSNHLIRPSRTFWNLNRWVTWRIDLLSTSFSTALAIYLVYGPRQVDASTVGFSLNQVTQLYFSFAVHHSDCVDRLVRVYFSLWNICILRQHVVEFSTMILWLVRVGNRFEVQSNRLGEWVLLFTRHEHD